MAPYVDVGSGDLEDVLEVSRRVIPPWLIDAEHPDPREVADWFSHLTLDVGTAEWEDEVSTNRLRSQRRSDTVEAAKLGAMVAAPPVGNMLLLAAASYSGWGFIGWLTAAFAVINGGLWAAVLIITARNRRRRTQASDTLLRAAAIDTRIVSLVQDRSDFA